MLKPWFVVSPEYGTVIPILDYGQGPMEYGRDVVRVEAVTKTDALYLGVKLMFRDTHCEWVDDAECPYAGVKVESALCEHGNTIWGIEDDECLQCHQAWEAERED